MSAVVVLVRAIRASALKRLGRAVLWAYGAVLLQALLIVAVCVAIMVVGY
jgi:hypothetical protein